MKALTRGWYISDLVSLPL